MRECDDGFVVGDGSLWVHVMSVEYRNAIDKVAYTLFCMKCPGFGCLSRVRVVTDNPGTGLVELWPSQIPTPPGFFTQGGGGGGCWPA